MSVISCTFASSLESSILMHRLLRSSGYIEPQKSGCRSRRRPHSFEIQGAQAPIGQKWFCYNSGVPPRYCEKKAEGKEDIRVHGKASLDEVLTAQKKCKTDEQRKPIRDFFIPC